MEWKSVKKGRRRGQHFLGKDKSSPTTIGDLGRQMQKRDGYTVRTEGKYQLITVQGKDLYIQHAKGINYVYAPEGRSIPAIYFAKNPDSWELSWNDGSGDIKILESYPSLSAAVLGMKETEDKWFEDHEGEPPLNQTASTSFWPTPERHTYKKAT
jgi:hypothetical protein